MQPRWVLAHFEWTCLCLNAGVEEVQPVMASVWPSPRSSFLLGVGVGGTFWVSDVHALPLLWPSFPLSLCFSPEKGCVCVKLVFLLVLNALISMFYT